MNIVDVAGTFFDVLKHFPFSQIVGVTGTILVALESSSAISLLALMATTIMQMIKNTLKRYKI